MRIEMGAPISMARDAQADAAIGHLNGFMEALKRLDWKALDLLRGNMLCPLKGDGLGNLVVLRGW